MKYEKYLPIGTIVMLKGGTKRMMIFGFCSISSENKVYDYCGCLYPEGFLGSDQILLFNHDQIDKIYCLGLQDQEEKEFKERLNQVVKNMNEGIDIIR